MKRIMASLGNKEVYQTQMFFFITGIIIPKFDDIYYYFLKMNGMSQNQFDYLAIYESFGIIVGSWIFISFFNGK
jgi:hypothetical protein